MVKNIEKWDYSKTIVVEEKKSIWNGIKNLILVYSYAYIISMVIVMGVIWFEAFINNNFKLLININVNNEVYPELIMHIIGIFSCVVFAYEKMKKTEKIFNIILISTIILGIILTKILFF